MTGYGHKAVPRVDLWVALPAVLIPLVMLFGASYEQGDTSQRVLGDPARLVTSAAIVAGLAAILYPLLGVGFRALDRAVAGAADRDLPSRMEMHLWTKTLWARMGLLMLFWLAWWGVHYPGTLDDDTVYQLLQSSGLSRWDNHHPVFDTWFFGLFWHLGDALGSKATGLAVFTLLNVLCTAFAMAVALRYMVIIGVPSRAVTCLNIALAVLPVIPMYAMSMTKDYLFSWLYLLFMVGFVEALRTRGEVLARRVFLVPFMTLALLVMLTKQTGLYIVIAAAIVLVASTRGRRMRVRALISLGAPVAVTVLFVNVLLPALGVVKTSAAEMYSVPMQQVARVLRDHPEDVTQSEREAIDRVLPVDQIGDLYVEGRSDAVKARWRTGVTSADTAGFLEAWLRIGLRRPGTYADAFAFLNLGYFYPIPSDDLYDRINPNFFNAEGMNYWYSILTPRHTTKDETVRELSGIEAPSGLDRLRGQVNSAYVDARHAPVLRVLLAGATSCFWVPLLVALYAVRRKNLVALLVLVPIAVNFATLVIGPIALPRYMSTCVYLIPVVLLLPFLRRRREAHVGTPGGDDAIGGTEDGVAITSRQRRSESTGVRDGDDTIGLH